MLARQRQQQILQHLDSRGGVMVSALSRELGVSEMTIRRDLQQLEQQGALIRTHGGALAVDIRSEPDFAAKADLLQPEKQRIAQAAAKLITQGVVGLSAGTTTTAVAAAFNRHNSDLTVVTNAVNIAAKLAGSDISVILTGGVLRSKSYALVGPMVQSSLENIWLDWLFLGANGVSSGGVTTPNLEEATANACLLARAKKVAVVADHSKLGKTAFGRITGLNKIDMLITDDGADRGLLKTISAQGVEVRLA